MGFFTSTTVACDFTEGPRGFLLGQAIDLNTLVWVLGMCLAIQDHHDDRLLALRIETIGQRAMKPKLSEVEECDLLFDLKWYAIEELRA